MRRADAGGCAGVGDGGVTGATDYGALLESLCDPTNSCGIDCHPWRLSAGGEEFVAATNGHRALYLAIGKEASTRQTALCGYDMRDGGRLSDLLATVPSPTHEVGRDALLAAVGLGDPLTGRPKPEKCRRCGGRGEVECDLAHLHDCPDCDGLRRIEAQHGPRWSADRDLLLLNGMPNPIDARMVRGVIENLPGDPILVSGSHKMVSFHGDGWVYAIATLDFGGCPDYAADHVDVVTTPILREKPEVAE